MYESPITRYTEDIMANIMKKEEGYLVESVHKVGFNIDKEGLAKAPRYDRDQYEKGFNDGRLSAESHWIPVTERLPENDDEVLVMVEFKRCLRRLQSPCEICQEFDCDGREFKSV